MQKLKLKSAFGLVEVIISSTIIMIILGAIIFLSRNIISNAQFSAERFQALQIAQRDIEKIRQIRDTNYIDEDPNSKWNSFLSGNAVPTSGNFYAIWPTSSGTTSYLKPISEPEKVESYPEASNIYNNQRYFRRVKIEDISGSLLNYPEIKPSPFKIPAYVVTVEVFWFDKQIIDKLTDVPTLDKIKKVTIAEIITDNRSGY